LYSSSGDVWVVVSLSETTGVDDAIFAFRSIGVGFDVGVGVGVGVGFAFAFVFVFNDGDCFELFAVGFEAVLNGTFEGVVDDPLGWVAFEGEAIGAAGF